MKKKLLLTITVPLFLSITMSFSSCEALTDTIWMCYEETYCANPWKVDYDESKEKKRDALDNYLSDQSVRSFEIEIKKENKAAPCFACNCTSGNIIYVKVPEKDKQTLINKDFYGCKN